MQSVCIFFKEGIYRICPINKTTLGASQLSNSVIFLDQKINLTELGIKTLEALNTPIVLVPHPQSREEWSESSKVWNQSMKIKSWKSFANNAKELELCLKDNKIEITPSKHGPPRGFFAFLPEKARFCSADDPEALGQAIIDAFADCE